MDGRARLWRNETDGARESRGRRMGVGGPAGLKIRIGVDSWSHEDETGKGSLRT